MIRQPSIHILFVAVFCGLMPKPVHADEGLAIDTAEGDAHLVICQNTFVCWKNGGAGTSVGAVAGDWRFYGSLDNSTWRIEISERERTPFDRLSISYDLTGNDKFVTVSDPKAKDRSDKWIRGDGIQAAEGAMKGWYLHPGKEKLELLSKEGRMVEVGTKPILTKEPYHFKFVEISP